MNVAPPPPAYLLSNVAPPPPPHLLQNVAPPPPVAMPARVRRACDTECYVDYWLASFIDEADPTQCYEFEMYPGKPLDIPGLTTILAQSTIITFNGKSYDNVMIAAALAGYDNAQLKWLSDRIIKTRLRAWDVEREFKLYVPSFIDDIDLIEVMPGQHGLKMYMAKMHSRRIQELPIPEDASISPEQRADLRLYCRNDLEGNLDAARTFAKEIKLRETMSDTFGIDLRSKSDAQIAEAIFKKKLGFKVERYEWAVGTWFNYTPPEYIAFQTEPLQNLLRAIREARFVLGSSGVEMPPELDSAEIKIGDSTYRLGIGGLHSSESKVFHYSDANYILRDIDVRSYYPTLILNSKMYPPQIGPAFQTILQELVDTRLHAKDSADELEKAHGKVNVMTAAIREIYGHYKATADSGKIVVNGTFGKLLSIYGILSAPKLGIHTTVTGQLSLLMFIEMLWLCGIAVVSANTDGVVVKCPRSHVWLLDQIVADWEKRTLLETEANDYEAVFSRDVNNYIAIKAKDRSVKLKGAFAPSVPVGGSWPNPTGEICVDAIVQYLLHRTPLEQTIRACTDVRKFVYVRNVKGGGVKYYGHEVEHATTKGGMRAQLTQAGWFETSKEVFHHPHMGLTKPMKEAHLAAVAGLREKQNVQKEYVGKVVRWYYASGQVGAIHYKSNGNLVPRTEGARPLMELPNVLPLDVDFAWYVNEAISMLADVGVQYVV